jgi:flagellar basal body-associated protein FliL
MLLIFFSFSYRDSNKMCEKEQKQKHSSVLALIVCILMAIICGTLIYATFLGGQNNGHFQKEIEALRTQIGQMLDQANGQKASVELQYETLDEIRNQVEQQEKGINYVMGSIWGKIITLHQWNSLLFQQTDWPNDI